MPMTKQRTDTATPAAGEGAAAATTPTPASTVSSASLAHLLATPPAPRFPLPPGIAVAAPSPTSQLESFPSVPFPPSQARFEPNMLGLLDDLPPPSMSAFFEASFDLLDGGWEL